MAWIESHQEIEKHPKTLDLMADLGLDVDQAIGKIHRLWWWCLSYAEDGDLRKHNDDRLGQAVGVLPGEPSKQFVAAMVKARWLDREPYFRVHNWWDYAGMLLQIRYKHDPKKWWKVRALYVGKRKNGCMNGSNNTTPTKPTKPTKPNQTEPEKSLNVKSVTTTPTTLRAGSKKTGTSQEYDKDVVDEIVAFCGDGKSRGYFITACRDFGGGLLREALGELKMRLAEGQSISNRGAYITSLIEDWGKEGARNGR